MFFKNPRMFFSAAAEGDAGGGGGSGDAGQATPDVKITAAREAAKAAGTHILQDWREAIPKEFSTDASMASIKDLGGLAKSYINAQKLIGSDKVPIPKDGASDEEWSAFFAKVGRPESPDKYEFHPLGESPEGFSMDPEFEKAFRTEAHKLGLNKKQAAAMWGSLQARAAQQFKGAIESRQAALTKEGEALKTEWGQAYPEKLKIAQKAVDAIERAGVKGLNAWLKKTGAGSEPIVMRLFALVGEQAGEEKLGPGSRRDAMTPREAEAMANRIMEEKTHPDYEAYWKKKHPRHNEVVQKVQGLLALTGA